MEIFSSEVLMVIFTYFLDYLRDFKSASEFWLEKMVWLPWQQKYFSVAE